MAEDDRYCRGLQIRSEVLGAEHVARAQAEAGELDRDFQEFITRYVWGEIWSREGLTRRERRMLTLAMLIARGQWDELAFHLRAALAGGLSAVEVREVILHAAVYCGVPAAHRAFKLLREIAAERERSASAGSGS